MSDSTSTGDTDKVRTAAAFLRYLRDSGLVEASRMGEAEAAVAPWHDAEGPMPEACRRALVESRLLTAWQVATLRQGLSKDFFLGKCRLLRPLGSGGMGRVFLAEHTTLRTKVAVKWLPVQKLRDKTTAKAYQKRFEQEAQAAARLSHPNVTRVLDLDVSDEARHFIVMEYIDGLDLDKRVKADGPLSVRRAADVIRQAALGFQHAHEEGLVHRDIKPANLMADRRGRVKILDLGLVQVDSAVGTSDTRPTEAPDDHCVGTPDYMSPEQSVSPADAQRAGIRTDRRSDIYSLGCTFYYLLTGKTPFLVPAEATNGAAKLRFLRQAHLERPTPNVLELRPDTPPEIADLIRRMMDKSPDARPQSMQEVADSLATWLALAADARASGRPRSGRALPPRRREGSPAADSLSPTVGPAGAGAAPLPQLRAGPAQPSRPASSAPNFSGDAAGSGAQLTRASSSAGWNIDIDTHACERSETLGPAKRGPSTSVGMPARPSSTADSLAADLGQSCLNESFSIRSVERVRRPPSVRQQEMPAAPLRIGASPVVLWQWLTRSFMALPATARVALPLVGAVVLAVAAFWMIGSKAGVENAQDAEDLGGTAASVSSELPSRERRDAAASQAPQPRSGRRHALRKPALQPGGTSPLDALPQSSSDESAAADQ